MDAGRFFATTQDSETRWGVGSEKSTVALFVHRRVSKVSVGFK